MKIVNEMAAANEVNYFTSDHLNELAAQPNSIVYTYAYDKPDPVAQSQKSDELKERIREIRNLYLTLKDLHTDDETREIICSKSAKWSHFARCYKSVFAWITDRTKPEDSMEQLNFLLYNKKRIELGQLTESQTNAIVQDYGLAKHGKKKRKNKP
jgi:hypothetical protein